MPYMQSAESEPANSAYPAASEPPTPKPPKAELAFWQKQKCHHGFSLKSAKRGIRARYRASRSARRYVRCTRTRAEARAARRYARRIRSVYAFRAKVRAVTPYRCGSHGRFAIPCAIIACESGFSWSAHNPSSPARGPYQLLSHGEPWPVRSKWDKLAHHRIAYALWNGGAGRGQWEC